MNSVKLFQKIEWPRQSVFNHRTHHKSHYYLHIESLDKLIFAFTTFSNTLHSLTEMFTSENELSKMRTFPMWEIQSYY